MDQQFRLKWNNHCNTLLQVFGNLLKTETLVDCTIGADGQYLKAHKVVVSACSPYFQSLFTEHFDKHPIIILKDIKFSELQSMIDYMYEGEVNISQDQLPSFLKAAASIQLKGLTQNVKPEQPETPKPMPQLNNAPRGMLSNGSLTPSSMLNVELEEGQQRKKRKMEPHPPSSASSSPSLVPDLVVPNVILDVPGETNSQGGGQPQNGQPGGGPTGENMKKEPSEYSGRSEDEEEDGMSHDGWDLSNDGLHDSNSTLSASDRGPGHMHHGGPPGANRAPGGGPNPALTGPDMSNVDENNQAKMEQLYRNIQNSPQMHQYRRQLAASSMPAQLQPNRSLPNPSAAFDAWSRIAFLNSNPKAKTQPNPLRGLLSVKSNHALGLNRNININIAQNIHLNPTLPPNNVGRNLVAEKNTRIRNEINRMIYTNSISSSVGGGIERYACNKCNRSYRNKNHLYRHVRYECDRKKRYQCGICLKDFYRKDNLKTHISYKHSEYKSSNFVLINKEEDEDEIHLDAHNNNNLVISKNELNEMLNKTDNTQQVLSILNNNDSTRSTSTADSDQKFLHLKLQQDQSNLQRSLLLRIQTENNKITPSQSEVLSKLLSAKSAPVQPMPPLYVFPRPAIPGKEPLNVQNKPGESAKVLRKNDEFIDLEDNFNINDDSELRSNEEDEDDEFVPIEPFVHIDIDSFQDVDSHAPRTSKKTSDDPDKKSVVTPDVIADTSEPNKEIKAILRSGNVENNAVITDTDEEKKTDATNETTSTLTEEAFKNITHEKTENENASRQELSSTSEDISDPNSKRSKVIEQNFRPKVDELN